LFPDDAIPPLYDPSHPLHPSHPSHAGHAGHHSEAPPPSSRSFAAASSTFRARLTETVATLREVALMGRDLAPVVPHHAEPHDDVVVLVHGFFASAGVFRPMRRHLTRDTSAKVASFTHAPGEGIERIARSLARLLDRIPAGCRVHLVGHSLGGVVARWYVQELGGHARVTQTISLGSPFGGTERAQPFRFLVGADLCRTSPTLARLRARAHDHDVPHLSVVADHDLVVVPCESAVFPRGEVVVLQGRGHNSLLYDPEAIRAVVSRIRQHQAGATLTSGCVA
jgi:pimeloyl-ACP methyl ester carboxylesterase